MDIFDLLINLLSSTFGSVSAGLVVFGLLLVLYRVSLHAVLLVGHVIAPDRDGDEAQDSRESGKYLFTFLIQNLEDVEYPGPFNIRLRCLDTKCELGRSNVRVYAGPKVVSIHPVREKDSGRVGCDLRFPSLPGFDTWRIDVQTGPTMIELSIGPEGDAPLVGRDLLVDVRPRKLAIDQKTTTHASAGGQRTPTIELFVWTMILGISAYLSAINIIAASKFGESVSMSPLGWWDVLIAAGFAVLLWAVFARIRRPVYPVMQGYLWQTSIVENDCERLCVPCDTPPGPASAA